MTAPAGSCAVRCWCWHRRRRVPDFARFETLVGAAPHSPRGPFATVVRSGRRSLSVARCFVLTDRRVSFGRSGICRRSPARPCHDSGIRATSGDRRSRVPGDGDAPRRLQRTSAEPPSVRSAPSKLRESGIGEALRSLSLPSHIRAPDTDTADLGEVPAQAHDDQSSASFSIDAVGRSSSRAHARTLASAISSAVSTGSNTSLDSTSKMPTGSRPLPPANIGITA